MLKGERLSLHEFTMGRFQGISCAYLNPSDKLITVYEGFADKESRIPVDENTIFPACSISKFITALCVMKADEKKMIDIDAPVNNYLSRWKLCTASGNESDASIRMVLCHVAGIVDGEDAFYGLRRPDPAISLIDILEGITSYNNRPARVEKAPGTEFEYSDAGYCVLQLLLEEITKKPFEDIAKEYFFDPLGLKETFFASQENVAFYEKNYVMATGYDENGLPIPEKYPQIPDLAASGLWSTPKELLIIAREFVNACNGNSSLLKNKTAHEMVKPVERFPWIGIGLFMGGENEVISRGWGENGQSMLKINYRTGEIAAVMTNQNPGVDQTESGLEGLVNNIFLQSEGNDIDIEKVDKGTPLAEDLLTFIENCSWVDVKEHMANLVRNWEFSDWETMFVAKADGKIIGMTSVMKEDYYPLPELYPWVSCVFVDEEYRGYGISGKLIDFANEYLKEQGFERSYIPTPKENVGLYEHYGYSFDKEITNYESFVDLLYSKKL